MAIPYHTHNFTIQTAEAEDVIAGTRDDVPVTPKALKPALDLKADDADLATVAKTGSYDDLQGKPTLGSAAEADAADFASAADGVLARGALPAPELKLRANIVDFDHLRGSDDTTDIWPVLKQLFEQPSSERDALMGGARLFSRGGRAYRGLTRPLITLPRFLHWEMEPGAFLDFSDVPGTFADNLLTYNGRYGAPARPVDADYLYGVTSIPFGTGVVAARGWKVLDRLLIRATEGLDDQLVGAFQKAEFGTDNPASFVFFSPGLELAVGDGVISTADGKSYRCTVAHTTGATIDLSKFAITGLNATGEDVYIEAIVGDTIYLTAPLRYSYPEESRPIFVKYEDEGDHTFRDFKFVGNHPTDTLDAGIWATGKTYHAGESVYIPRTEGSNGRDWLCLVDHTSGTWLTDRAAGYWRDLGSDRVFRFGCTRKVLIEGGRIDRSSGYALVASSVADLVVRDLVGTGTNKRSGPGGYFALSGSYNKALLDNVTVHSACQGFMTTVSGGEYGVSYGTVYRDCTVRGGNSGFTQHWMEDGAVYESCEVDGGVPAATGGSAFDIRSPSKLLNCRALNTGGRAIVLRHNFGGFGRADNSDRGTVIHGFEAHNVLTGIALDNQFFNPGPGTIAWPTGRLEIRNSKLTRVGGTGSLGAIYLMWSVGTGGVVGTGPYPLLGKLHIEDVLIDVKSDQHVVRIAGRWDRPVVKNIKISPSEGFTPSGGFRSFWIYNAGVAGENRPINPDIKGIEAVGGFGVPQYNVLRDDVLPTAASASVLIPDTTAEALFVSGSTQINQIASANIFFGRIVTLIFTGAVTVSHNNLGAGGSAAVLLQGSTNFTAKAGDVLTLRSDGLLWREIGRVLS